MPARLVAGSPGPNACHSNDAAMALAPDHGAIVEVRAW
jgi:hypothetical protein